MPSPKLPPLVSDFKTQFFRDFPFAEETDQSNLSLVVDIDIQNAINQASITFSGAIIDGDKSDFLAFLYLTAHYLVKNIQNAQKGLNAQAKFPLLSTGVGSVNISNNISDRFSNDPMFSMLLTTGYGQVFLDMVYPYTIGNVGFNCGTTTFA